ncbi:hypothetical protein EOD07_27130 [Mesorhizobium sp. M2C.T.Ca.TU.002.02.1.1]|nr:hypothetical protein EOD07_27130 [Mesorhizobium sp. M2C.T.Ca.TU.002.02.1.1]
MLRQLTITPLSRAIQIGIGYALYEDVVIDRVTGRMRAVEEGEPTGPFGAKAVGEIATIPVAAAIVNAVNDALGTELTELPLSPERILAAMAQEEPRCGAARPDGSSCAMPALENGKRPLNQRDRA